MSSLPFTSPLEEEEEEEEEEEQQREERPGSSLSTASRSSRIPVLTRSASLRVKSSTSGMAGQQVSSGRRDRVGVNSLRGIVRSASFGSCRGISSMTSTFSSSTMLSSLHHSSTTTTPRSHQHQHQHHHHHTKALTPETPRRVSCNTTTHGRGNTMSSTPSDRKSHSYAGLGSSSWHPNLTHHSHTRRPNHLPITSHGSHGSHTPSSVPTTPGSQPETPSKSPDFDDTESLKSVGSVLSSVSCDAGQHQHTRNGRSLKYVLHCRHTHDDHDPDKYLTPTQRASRRIRELKTQLTETRREVHTRDAEISRLTRELVELRLLKARTHHWDNDTQTNTEGDTSTSQHLGRARSGSERVVVSEVHPARATPNLKATSTTPSEGSEPELSRLLDALGNGVCEVETARVPLVSPATRSASDTTGDSVELTRSLADSGHYDDLTSPALSARDPFEVSQGSSLRGQPIEEDREAWQEEREVMAVEEERLQEEVRRLREELRRQEEALRRIQMEECNDLKEKHNDRVESLLAKLSDANLKYFELRPQYTKSQERVRELEAEVAGLRQELGEAELRHQKMYLQMFLKGQQAARLQAHDDDTKEAEGGVELSDGTAGGAVVELMRQLTTTQEELEKVKALYQREVMCRNNNNNNNHHHHHNKRNGELDPEVTLQFLKSAIYYFLTDKDNARGHLRAIESILGYTDRERNNMNKAAK